MRRPDRATVLITAMLALFVILGVALVVYWALLLGPVAPSDGAPDCAPGRNVFWIAW